VRGDQLAVRAIQHVHEAVLVRLNHHLADLSLDREVGKHVLVGAVHVVNIVGRVLVVTDDLAGLRPDRQHARCIKIVPAFARPRIIGLRIAGAPIDEVELRIIRP
jgi:hypothetical protein